MTTLVFTVIGDDQSGLVESLAGAVTRHGGNWDRSSMARLGTKFAGIVEVTVPEQRVDHLIGELGPLEAQGLLDITVERADEGDGSTGPALDGAQWELRIIGQDRPGIVHEVAHALARSGVSIEELRTFTSSAPMSAEIMFEASAVLVAAEGVDLDALTAELEALANELMVDIDLST
jgi:glycine cleavage system regulatory protein